MTSDLPYRSPAGGARGVDTARRVNLSIVLRAVLAHGGASRAQLTVETGLNRSTVGDITAELARRGLVEEGAAPPRGVGRPSPVILPGERVAAFAVYPDADSVTVALVRLNGELISKIRHDTASVLQPEEMLDVAAALAGRMREQHSISILGAGLALPGQVRSGEGVLTFAPPLGWREVPVAAMLEARIGLPVAVANDGAAGALAEAVFGVGRNVQNLIYLNGSARGIGGGVVADGRILTGHNGYAGEFGHVLVDPRGAPCACGARGCLETAVRRQDLLAILGLPESQSHTLEERLRIGLAGESGEELEELIGRQLDALTLALRSAVNAFNPELVVLGGFLGALLSVSPETVERSLLITTLTGGQDGVHIVRPALGENIVLIGAAQLAFERIIADPLGGPSRADQIET